MTIQQIKSTLPIQKVLSHYNLGANRNNLLRCPFHENKTPSLQIFPKTNSFTCFSTKCTAGSDDPSQLLELLQKKEFTKLRMSLQRSGEAREYAAKEDCGLAFKSLPSAK